MSSRSRHRRRPARRVTALLVVAHAPGGATLAYRHGWPRAFQLHPRFDCEVVDVCARWARLRTLWWSRGRIEAVIVLHSAFSNSPFVGPALAERLRRLPARRAFFIGNEYKLMPEKMEFCEALGVDLLVSQLSSLEAHELYRKRLGCAVVGIPNAGVDESVFAPRLSPDERPVDLGYRAYRNPPYLGHDERREIAERLGAAAEVRGLVTDISLDPVHRFDEEGWAAFLNRCKGQLGTEAGGDYFELTDATRNRVNAYLDEHPDAPFEEIFDRFFRDYRDPVSGRALSGRIVEAAATKTAQVLLEGEYGGYFIPGEHYLPIRKDFSNVEQALDELADDARRREVAEAAYALAREELTYARLIDRFFAALEPLL